MNVGKLKRVAIKEFKRSPAKTGFLLAMLPVALYFCVPLLLGASKKSSPSTGAAAVAAVPKNASFVSPAATNAVDTPSRVGRSWVEVSRSLENDMLAMPVGISATARNPFTAIIPKKIDNAAAAGNDGEPDNDPKDKAEPIGVVERSVVTNESIRLLDFQLTATMVGQRTKLATINGKTYAEGKNIHMPKKPGMAADAVKTVPVKLVHVDRRFVVLAMDGKEHTLQLPDEVPQDAFVVKSRPE